MSPAVVSKWDNAFLNGVQRSLYSKNILVCKGLFMDVLEGSKKLHMKLAKMQN